MTATRTGKIARLPLEVREELNVRLLDGQQGKNLVPWLNSLPEVRRIVAAEFAGRPVREQNLSEWRKGGYRDWLLVREARAAIASLTEEAPPEQGPDEPELSDTLARWIAARYAVATRRLATGKSPEQWRLLREMCGDVIELRRGDHSAKRLALERTRVATLERSEFSKYKRKTIIALELFQSQLGRNPAAKAAFEALAAILRHPFDPSESE